MSISEITGHASTSTNSNPEESFSQKEQRRDRQGSEHSYEAIQNVPSFDFVWTIEGFSLLPKLGRHFTETFDAMGLKWGLFLVPWCHFGCERYPTLTLYLEDEPCNVEESGDRSFEKESGDRTVFYRITMFNQGCGNDKQYRHTVDGVFARRLACKWERIKLLGPYVFLDPSYGFLVDDTCVFGVEILNVASTYSRPLPASDSYTGRFTWAIRGFSAEQEMKPCIYKKFSACGYDWIAFVLVGRPHSLGAEERLQIYISLSASSHTLCQLFGRFKIRLVNQLNGNHIDRSCEHFSLLSVISPYPCICLLEATVFHVLIISLWFNCVDCSLFHSGKLHGCAGVVPLRTFYDEAEGFLVQDRCIVELEVSVLERRPKQEGINFYRGHAVAVDKNAYHNPFAWDMSPYWSIFGKDPRFDITDLLFNHTYRSLDGYPLG